MSVSFAPEGDGFLVYCGGEPLHMSKFQEIAQPPPWWRERIWDTGPVTIYWRKDSSIASDGTLGMPVSGRDAEGCLWSGAMTLRPSEKDYGLWRWIIRHGDRYKAILSDKALESIRQEHHRSAEGAGSASSRALP